MTLDEIAAGLAAGWSAPHRVAARPSRGVTIVDDSYNASPRSVVAALDLLAGLPGRRGRRPRRDARAGRGAATRAIAWSARPRPGRVDWLVVVGPDAARIAEGAVSAGLDRTASFASATPRPPSTCCRPACATATSCWSRRRAGSASTRWSTACVASSATGARDDARLRPVELIQGLLLAFALMVILMSPYIRLLHALGFGKRIRQDGPESHYIKEGTPTMGGLLIVAVVIGIYFFLRAGPDASTFAPLAALAGVGALGAFDDYLNARTGEGIRARQKLIWLTVVAFVAAWQIQQTYDITAIAVPFVGAVSIDPRLYVAFARVRHHRRRQRREPDRRARRPVGRDAGDRLRRVHAHRAAQRAARPAEPRPPVRPDHRRAARVPVVQRPPGADLHRRFGGARR